MDKPFRFTFPNGLTADTIQVQPSVNLSPALDAIGLPNPRPVLVVVGGASGLSEAKLERLRSLFVEVLAPLAEALGAAVVDGGTDAGVMQLMGQARAEIGATFPLIGVAPFEKIAFPDANSPDDAAPLEPHHTHFVLVPGSNWGDESPWIARVAGVLADRLPSVTVLVNGGEISWEDVSQSIKAGRPVIAIIGSGRTADALAAALHGEAIDNRARILAASGLVQAINPMESSKTLARAIEKILSAQE